MKLTAASGRGAPSPARNLAHLHCAGNEATAPPVRLGCFAPWSESLVDTSRPLRPAGGGLGL
jgi:hypothetical protein